MTKKLLILFLALTGSLSLMAKETASNDSNTDKQNAPAVVANAEKADPSGNILTVVGVLGDVNGDGKVTPADAIMILYHYFNVEQNGFNIKLADVNKDGTVSPADAIEALYIFFKSGNDNQQPDQPSEHQPQ